MPASQGADNADRPFCSNRCRRIDLGRWLAEDYRIPGPPADVPEGADDDEDAGG